MKTWLQKLKVGDKVIKHTPFIDHIYRVSAITKTGLIKVNEQLFNPKTGIARETYYRGFIYLNEYTTKRAQEINNREDAKYLRHLFSRSITWDEVPLEHLLAIHMVRYNQAYKRNH